MSSFSEKIKTFYARHSRVIKVLLYIAWAVLFAFLAYTVWKSRQQLLLYLVNANYSQFIIITIIYLIALFLAVLNWSVIMHAFDSAISLWMHAKIYLVSMVSRRLPGTIWYVGGRMLLYKHLGVPSINTASASGIEFIISFIADALLAAIFIPLGINLSKTLLIPLGIVVILGLYILQPTNLGKIMVRLKHPLAQPVRTGQVFGWLFLRIALVLTGGLMIFFTIRIFTPIGFDLLLFVLGARALSGAAGMLTYLLPSSMGASDITLLAMLSSIVPTPLATVIALLVRIYTTLFELIIGFIFFIILNKSFPFSILKSAKEEDPEEKLNEEYSEERLQEYQIHS
ncbi:MAG TPA: hypothetical protein DDW97_02360 [Anaerolineaceae bacterium]|nr:hypothetical protein [Anaerolineaceae bacterium]